MQLLILVALISAPHGSAIQKEPSFANSNAITVERLRAHLEFIASDELEGRGTPSRGVDIACMYVASLLKQWGATPAGDTGSYFQKIPLVRTIFDPAKSELAFGTVSAQVTDFVAGGQFAGHASGPLVYVGHGQQLSSKGIDPYAGLAIKGKIIVATDGLPAGCTPSDIDRAKDLSPKMAAKALGAVGIIIVPRTDFWAQTRWENIPAPYFAVKAALPPKPETGVPLIVASPKLVAWLFESQPVSAEAAGRALDPKTPGFAFRAKPEVAFTVAEKEEIAYTQNVIATMPGSDSKLRNEYVGFGAHIDHVGTRNEGEGDKIYNGADDNASGTVGLLEIAHAFLTAKPPKRSLIFMWFGAEEAGLWGSKRFVDNPTIDLKSLGAYINMDMIGKSKPFGAKDPKYLDLTEPDEVHARGLSKMSSSFEKLVRDVNSRFLKLRFNMENDEGMGSGRMPGGSDHASFFEKGIPTFAWHTGFHQDYHGVGDEASKIDFEKIAKISKTTYACGLTLANQANRPVVDRPQTRVDFERAFVRLRPGATAKLAASVKGQPNVKFAWSVESPNGGSVSADGSYTAPTVPGRFRVRASVEGQPGVYGIANLIVEASAPIESGSPIAQALEISVFSQLQNGGFESTTTGGIPAEWFIVKASADDGYAVESSNLEPFSGSNSLLLKFKNGPGQAFGNVRQAVSAVGFRGKKLRFRAAVRHEAGAKPGQAQLWMRIEGVPRRMLAIDTMADRPIKLNRWAEYEIVLAVPQDAEVVIVGLILTGDGKAWIDSATLAPVD